MMPAPPPRHPAQALHNSAGPSGPHVCGTAATAAPVSSLVNTSMFDHHQFVTGANTWGARDSVSDWAFLQPGAAQENPAVQGATAGWGPSSQGPQGSSQIAAQGNLIPGSVPRHQSAILGARLAWGAAPNPPQGFLSPRVARISGRGGAPTPQLPGSSSVNRSLNRSRNGSRSDAHLCSRPASPSSFDSKDSLKESLNNGQDQQASGNSCGVGMRHQLYSPPHYSQLEWRASVPAGHSAFGLPPNAKYLSAPGEFELWRRWDTLYELKLCSRFSPRSPATELSNAIQVLCSVCILLISIVEAYEQVEGEVYACGWGVLCKRLPLPFLIWEKEFLPFPFPSFWTCTKSC